jgi:Kyakuja-Dileera-Zisupton transposase
MWNANSKKSEGLRATGIGAVICARHALYRPNGMGDLQKGERYVYILLLKFILIESLIHAI